MDLAAASIADPATVQALALVRTGLGRLADRPLSALGDRDLLALTRQLGAVKAQLEAIRLRQLAEIDDRGAALTVGAASTLAWIKGATRTRHADAVRDLRLAHALDDRYVDTAATLATGGISAEHAEEIRACIDALPAHVDPAARCLAERELLAQAAVHDPRALHRLGQHLHSILDPDGPEDVARAEADAFAARALWVQPYDDGRVRLRGSLDPETGALFLAALEPLSVHRPEGDEADERTLAQRRADGFGDLIRLATAHAEIPTAGGAVPTLVVTTSWESLRDGVGAGMLDSGSRLTPQTVLRLACDAGIIPAVLGTRDEPLAIGRKTRVVPSAIRRALVLRDQHCRFPACRRPPAQCHAHHISHWSDGGPTDLLNLTLLCAHHHRVVHADGWIIIGQPGAPPLFTPPDWTRTP